VDALNGLGLALYRSGKLDEAAKVFEQVAGVDISGNVNAGALLQHLGQRHDALLRYRALLDDAELDEHAPRCDEGSTVWCNLGVAMLRAGKLELTATALQSALRLNSKNMDALYNLGLLHLLEERYEDALLNLSSASGLAPNRSEPRNALGVVLEEMGRVGEALEQFEGACRLRCLSRIYQRNLGRCLVKLQRYEEAAALYHKMIEERRLLDRKDTRSVRGSDALDSTPHRVGHGNFGDDVEELVDNSLRSSDSSRPKRGKNPLIGSQGSRLKRSATVNKDDEPAAVLANSHSTIADAHTKLIDITGELGLCALYLHCNRGNEAVTWGGRAMALQPSSFDAMVTFPSVGPSATPLTHRCISFRSPVRFLSWVVIARLCPCFGSASRPSALIGMLSTAW
jgi:pentatricopeptide repeat protein